MQRVTFLLLGRRGKTDQFFAGIFLLSVFAFLLTGRSNQSYGDYAPVYGSARAVALGMDPYRLGDMETALAQGGADMTSYAEATFWPTHPLVYPPLTYYVLYPVSLLRFTLARNVWLAILAISFVGGGAMIVRYSPPSGNRFVLCGVSLIVASSGLLLRLGQLSGVAIGLSAAAGVLFVTRRHMTAASCLFFLAAALKPQLAIPLMVYFCFPRQTRKFAVLALASFSILLATSCLALASKPPTAHWPTELSSNLKSPLISAVPGERLDTGLINPQALLVLVTGNPRVYGTLNALLLGIVVVALVSGLRRLREHPARDWLAVAAISIVTLLLTYHRTYDMRMVMLTLPALALLWRAVPRVAALLTFLSCFLLFSTAILLVHLLNPHLSHATTHGFMFRFLVERQQALFVLLTAVAWIVFLFMADGFGQPLSACIRTPALWVRPRFSFISLREKRFHT